jgi:hypothetical protein
MVAGLSGYPPDAEFRDGENHYIRHVAVVNITTLVARLDLEDAIVELVVSQLVRERQERTQRTDFAFVYGGIFTGEDFVFDTVFDQQHAAGAHVLIPFVAGQQHFQLLEVDFS